MQVVLLAGAVLPLLFVIKVYSTQASQNDDEANEVDTNFYRLKAREMFLHAFNGYMKHAFPHDELMPLSCKGRQRGVTPNRGGVDDTLGNFSLTLVDSLDTLVVVGEYEEFERAVKLVIENVRFDSDLVVSVFETNIRMVGGLISGHLMSLLLKRESNNHYLSWYTNQLLTMASNLADKLLPAFNSTTGVPYSRVNLKRGLFPSLRSQQDTCTACGGTMILEWAALSRLTGNPIYEEKARKALDFLWNQRSDSDLVGSVLNVDSGNWIRHDSGIGAGIDSYYEYTLKAYILLDEEVFLHRFNKHYKAIMQYLNKGPVFIDVNMNKPNIASRSYMDSLMAFWPSLQVLKGDLQPAIEIHEMLYSVIKKHQFLPEAFTHDLQVHWPQHPLRPEFVESTYFLYRATKDPYYLDAARRVLESLDSNVRTKCGFASVKDIRTMEHEDEMESFVLAETFKYLYLIFSKPGDLLFDPDHYVLTTEAHFLPLSIGDIPPNERLPRKLIIDPVEISSQNWVNQYRSASPPNPLKNTRSLDEIQTSSSSIRKNVNQLITNLQKISSSSVLSKSGLSCPNARDQLAKLALDPTNSLIIKELQEIGIEVELKDSRMKIVHSLDKVSNALLSICGLKFFQEVEKIISSADNFIGQTSGNLAQIVSYPHFGNAKTAQFSGSAAQFGLDLSKSEIYAELSLASPNDACSQIDNPNLVVGKVAIVKRGNCTFQDKTLFAQQAGAVGIIITDNNTGTSSGNSRPFTMAADDTGHSTIKIPAIFIFHLESQKLLHQLIAHPRMIIRLGSEALSSGLVIKKYFRSSFLPGTCPNPGEPS